MEGSKLQLDTWEAIWQFVYANKALPAILDIKASDYCVFMYGLTRSFVLLSYVR